MTRSKALKPTGPSEIEELITELVAGGGVSAAAAVVGTGRRILHQVSMGVATPGPEIDIPPATHHLFDLASLTKPCMATLALRLDEAGRLPLEVPLGEAWPKATEPLRRKTLEELLRHRAGFQPWTPLYRRCRQPEKVAELLLGGELLGSRAGTYSDLDYVLWGLTAERLVGESLDHLVRIHLADPLGTTELKANPGPSPRTVPCLLDNARERQLAARQGIAVALQPGPSRGVAQDCNARFLGGLAGHAGLFGSAESLWRLARAWLRPDTLLERRRVAAALDGPGRWLVGWSRRQERGDAGGALSPPAYGHIGFTGGSLWIDPEADRIMVLLAHRTRVGFDLTRLRRRFCRLALSLV